MALRAPDELENLSIYPDHNLVVGYEQPRPSKAATSRKIALLLGDLNALAIALFLSVLIHRELNPTDPVLNRSYFLLLLASTPLWPVSFAAQDLYKARFIARGADEGWRIIKAVGGGFVGVGILSIMSKVTLGRTWLLVAFPLALAAVAAERLVARRLFKRARRRGQMMRRVVIIGRNTEGMLVRDMLDVDTEHGYEVVGFAEDLVEDLGARNAERAVTDAGLMLDLVRSVDAAGVIIAATAIDIGTSNRLIRTFTENGIHVELSSTLCDIASHRLTIRPLGRFPMVYIEPTQRHGWRPVAKRSFDVAVSALMLVILSPLVLGAMAAIKFTSSGGVFFRQERVGRNGSTFKVLKFRTMVPNAEEQLANVRHLNEAQGPIFKIKNDPRITRVGRLLRKTSIDELPQLVNVLRGEMSLVGPRPALPSEVDLWDASLHNRLRVQPGITGMWQVSGRSDAGGDYGQLDLYYVDNWTLFADLVIIMRTIPAVITQRGAC